MSNVVEVSNLTKSFGSVLAVNQVSFSIEAGKIYGLLGRNGAGKTTIMQIITAQLFATSGEVKVFGAHPYENSRVLSQVCFVSDSQKYPNDYRVLDVLEQAALFFPHWDQEYAFALGRGFPLAALPADEGALQRHALRSGHHRRSRQPRAADSSSMNPILAWMLSPGASFTTGCLKITRSIRARSSSRRI